MNTEQLHTNFTVVSISYEKANADIRGKFSFFSNQVFPLCKNVQEKKLGKFFVISTCNRTEIYCYSDDYTKIIHEYCNVIQVNYSEFITYCDVYKSGEAVKHLFRVSGGLESQILGDFEIISQVRTWYKRFQKLGSTNFYLERVVNTAIQISKKIKTHTSLSSGITSVSYATVHYLLNEVQNLQDKKILIIGIGKIGRNTSENLIKHISENQVTLMNRTNEKAIAIAEKLGIQTRKYEELQKQVNQSDVIIVATSAPNPIVTKSMITESKERLFIDLSIPENISKNIKEVPNTRLVNVDDLSKTIDKTIENRKSEIPKAEEIIEEYIGELESWLEHRKYVPVIKSLKNNLVSIQENEVKSVTKSLIDLNSDDYILTNKMSQRITNRFAEFLTENPDKAEYAIEIFTEMFQLEHQK